MPTHSLRRPAAPSARRTAFFSGAFAPTARAPERFDKARGAVRKTWQGARSPVTVVPIVQPPRGYDIPPPLLGSALEGDAAALETLARALRPAIQAEVVRVLARSRGSARGRDLRQEVDDFVQEVWLGLFANDARELRRWRPEMAPLTAYVRGIAFCDAISRVRSRTRSPFTEDPTLPEDLAPVPKSEPSPETKAISRDLLHRLIEAVRADLGPRGAAVFELLVLREQPVELVCASLEMSEDAVYAWKSRITKLARRLRDELLSE